MRINPAISPLARVLFTLGLCGTQCGILWAQESQLIMRQVVAGQARTEIALQTSSQPTLAAADAIRLVRVVGVADGLDLWRATLPSDHSHPYLLATLNGAVVRLGGFTAPELRAVASRFASGGLDTQRVRARSEQLALLADPNGAVQWVYVTKADQPGYGSTVVSAWRKRAPKDWPRDTVLATQAGWFAQLTLLSRDTRSFTLHWVPLALSFEFDRDGQLLAWAQRRGEVFRVAGVPVASPGAADRR